MQTIDYLEAENISPDVKTEHDLQLVMDVIKKNIFPRLRLWEFYIINIDSLKTDFQHIWLSRSCSSHGISDQHRFENINISTLDLRNKAELLLKEGLIINSIGSRYAKTLRISTVIAFMEKLLLDMGESAPSDKIHQIEIFVNIVNEINLVYYKEWDEDFAAICENIMNRARYLRVDGHGPRLGPISETFVKALHYSFFKIYFL